jgi:hypothetical protein
MAYNPQLKHEAEYIYFSGHIATRECLREIATQEVRLSAKTERKAGNKI